MRIALIGDVHGNLPALEAVLADAEARGAEALWNVGDFVGYGAFPDEVVRRLRDAGAESIVGNYDRKVLRFPRKRERWRRTKRPEKFHAFQWTYQRLSSESLSYLASLPRERRVTVQGRRVLITHGSPASEDEPLTDATGEDRLAELAGLAEADVVVFGHSHRPVHREVAGVLFFGTGSVGRPEGGDPRACYGLMEIAADRLSAEHRRVEYDLAGAAAAIRAAGLPEAFAQMVLRGENYDGVALAETDRAERERAVAAVRALGRRCGVEQGHTRQVTKLALRLFDELVPLHGLGARERFDLRCGAMLHDIGWVDGRRGHHKTACRLILGAEDLPFDERSRHVVASIARYHRKALPKATHEHFAVLGVADRRIVRVLAGVLRVADGLDRSHRDVVADVRCEVRGEKVVVHCVCDGSADAELWGAARKVELLEQVLDRPVVFEVG